MRKTFTGLHAWLVQRISAVYMLFFIVFLLTHFVVDPPHSYQAWHAWMMGRVMSIATAVFFAALLAHAWVGLRDVIWTTFTPLFFARACSCCSALA